MKHIFAVVAVVLFMVLPILAAPPSGPPSAKVVVALVTEKEVSKTNRNLGLVDFDIKAGLSPEIGGLISSQHIQEGMTVKKGDVLVRLQNDFIQKDLEILAQRIRQADIKIDNNQKSLKRYEILFKENLTSEKFYDDLSDNLRELVVQKQILIKEREKKELELAKSLIRAPFAGLVLKKFSNQGEWISLGNPICTLADIASTHVKVAISEELARYVKKGQSLSIEIPALDKSLSGAIIGMVPIADPKSKTFQIKIAFPYFDNIVQNMTAAVNVPVSFKERLRMIKRDALVRNQGKDFIYTVEDGKAKILPVEIVSVAGEFIGVDAPYITTGMPVVVDGNDRLRPGQPVTIIETK